MSPMLSRTQGQVQKGYRTLNFTILVEWNHDCRTQKPSIPLMSANELVITWLTKHRLHIIVHHAVRSQPNKPKYSNNTKEIRSSDGRICRAPVLVVDRRSSNGVIGHEISLRNRKFVKVTLNTRWNTRKILILVSTPNWNWFGLGNLLTHSTSLALQIVMNVLQIM